MFKNPQNQNYLYMGLYFMPFYFDMDFEHDDLDFTHDLPEVTEGN